MKTKNIKQKTIIGTSIIAALSIVSTSPALATTEATVYNKKFTKDLGYARFTPGSRRFYVKDLENDGRGVYIQWRIPSTGQSDSGDCYALGNGNSRTCPPILAPRRQRIIWKVCAIDVDGKEGRNTKCEKREDRT
jgi:hypothetical protein